MHRIKPMHYFFCIYTFNFTGYAAKNLQCVAINFI